MAEIVRGQRAALDNDSVPRQTESAASEWISATLDCYRALRDAASEAMFFQTFGSMFALTMTDQKREEQAEAAERVEQGREMVARALAAIDAGGYAAAVARMAYLLARHGEPLPLERLALRDELRRDYADLLPDMESDEWRRLRGEQEIIARHAPEQALATLPKLLAAKSDRERLQRLVERVLDDPRTEGFKPTAEQRAMIDVLRSKLRLPGRKRAARSAAPKRPAKKAAARAERIH
jgi:hypothetical protein